MTKKVLIWDNRDEMPIVWVTCKNTTNKNAVIECSKYYNPYGNFVQDGRFEFMKKMGKIEK